MSVLKVWSMSLSDLTHVHFECPFPLPADDLADTLALLELITRQVRRFGTTVSSEELPAPPASATSTK